MSKLKMKSYTKLITGLHFYEANKTHVETRDRLVLDEIIAKVKNAVLNADPPNFNVRDLIGFK